MLEAVSSAAMAEIVTSTQMAWADDPFWANSTRALGDQSVRMQQLMVGPRFFGRE
jgi:hypothetical protein